MAKEAICYSGELPPYNYNVTFLVKETKSVLVKSFDSDYLARKFVNKLKHSKRCVLLSHPIFK